MHLYSIKYPDAAILAGGVSIDAEMLAKAAFDANRYLQTVDDIFKSKKINFFEALGVTNISATVGEIYARFLCKQMPEILVSNPHPDGRPDVLCLASEEAKEYFRQCFEPVEERLLPTKKLFTPFKYGGIEVKCTIGSSFSSDHKDYLQKEYGSQNFPIGVQRIRFLSNINWVAHHVQNIDLLGLYYDYIPECGNAPQIVAGFFNSLTAESWNPVSHGDARKKTTSMTSIKGEAQKALKENCVFMMDSELYSRRLSEIGVKMR